MTISVRIASVMHLQSRASQAFTRVLFTSGGAMPKVSLNQAQTGDGGVVHPVQRLGRLIQGHFEDSTKSLNTSKLLYIYYIPAS